MKTKTTRTPKIAIALGTRPEIIKTAPVISLCVELRLPFFVIHTGQHYSRQMDAVFFEQLNLPEPDFRMEVGSGFHGEQTGLMLSKIEKVLMREQPDVVLVQGDTNTVLAASLAAVKCGIMVGHIEAGLRSYDKTMPEEINRIIADHISGYLFTPTITAKNNLIKEGISDNIFVTGNTIVEALLENIQIAEKLFPDKNAFFQKLNVSPGNFLLVTLHRQENVDNKDRLDEILQGIGLVQSKFQFPVLLPMHPRTLKNIKEFNLHKRLEKFNVIEPLGYFEFLMAEKNAGLLLTDSGGVQEEGCIFRVPCVTIRENTERPETIEAGSNILAGWQKEKILSCSEAMLARSKDWENPFGDGGASKMIIEIVKGGLP